MLGVSRTKPVGQMVLVIRADFAFRLVHVKNAIRLFGDERKLFTNLRGSMNNPWNYLPEQSWLAIVVDRAYFEGGDKPKLEIIGFDDEDNARIFCETYDSYNYQWAVVTGNLRSSGETSDGSD